MAKIAICEGEEMVCMTINYTRLVAVLIIIAAAAGSAFADVVTVTPSNPGAWSWATQRTSDKTWFTTGGPAPAEGNPAPTGNGAFYFYSDWPGDYTNDGDSVWLGIDQFNGQPLEGISLKQLTKLESTVYNSQCYCWLNATVPPQIRTQKQPMMMNITVQDPAGNRRQFWHRPAGLEGRPGPNNRRQWLTIDGVANTMTPNYMALIPEWYEVYSDTAFASWFDLINTAGNGIPYGDWTLVPTSTGWNPDSLTRTSVEWKACGWGATSGGGESRSTGTGKPINMWAGCRKASAKLLKKTAAFAWWQESAGQRGFVDTVTIGVDYDTTGTTPDIVETTYDFAADDPTPPRKVALSHISNIWRPSPVGASSPYAWYAVELDGDQLMFNYKVVGKVVESAAMYPTGTRAPLVYQTPAITPYGEFVFTVWDGTYMNSAGNIYPACVDVYLRAQDCTGITLADPATWPVHLDDIVGVEGFIYERAVFKTEPPLSFYAQPSGLVNYTQF